MSENLKVNSNTSILEFKRKHNKSIDNLETALVDIEELQSKIGQIDITHIIDLEGLEVGDFTLLDIANYGGKTLYDSANQSILYPLNYVEQQEAMWFEFGTSTITIHRWTNLDDEPVYSYINKDLNDIKQIVANPTIQGTESTLNSLKIGNTNYKIFTDSGIMNLGQLYFDIESQKATFQLDNIPSVQNPPSSGLCILMFNTTCVIFPYSVSQENRFVCNTIYNQQGQSRITRGKLIVSDGTIIVRFDDEFSDYVLNNDLHPYGIIRFIGI